MIRFSDSIAIKAPVEEVFSVLTDFEHYPKFIKEVKDVEVLSTKGNRSRVKFCVNMVKDVSYTLDMEFVAPKKISWTQVESDIITKQEGGWTLTSLDAHVTDLAFDVDIAFPFWVPTSLAEAGIKAGMPNMMKAFKKEAEARTGKSSKKTPAKKKEATKKKR